MNAATQLRVLVIEDEGIVRIAIECMLADLGHVVAGSAASIDDALAIGCTIDADAAVLDLNLGGRSSAPVADMLAERRIPFVIASGYTSVSIPERHRHRPTITKPFEMRNLAEALVAAVVDVGCACTCQRGYVR